MVGFLYMLAVAMPPVGRLLMAAAGGEEGGGELPNVVGMLTHNEGPLNAWVSIIYAILVSIILCVIVLIVYARRRNIPGPLQNVVEMAVEGAYDFLYNIMGENTKKYLPLLGTLFFYILFMNLMGLIPGGFAPSTDRNITASLALIVFIYAQYTGLTKLGIKKYVHHYLGAPQDLASWLLSPLFLIIHIFGELAKPVSLAARLFGNITGEDLLIGAFVSLGVMALSFFHSPIGLPLQIPFILLGLLLSTIQALVFSLLSTIYIFLMLPHEEHDTDKVEHMQVVSNTLGLMDITGISTTGVALDLYQEGKKKGDSHLGLPKDSKRQNNH